MVGESLDSNYYGTKMKKIIILIFGLPGSGKTTLARAIREIAQDQTIWFNADKVRSTLSKDLGFSAESRIEQARRMGCLASLALDGSDCSTAIVDFVNPTVETYESFLANLCRPAGSPADRVVETPSRYFVDVSYPVFSVLMRTIKKEECRFRDTAEVFQHSLSGGVDYSVDNYLTSPEAFREEAIKIQRLSDVLRGS